MYKLLRRYNPDGSVNPTSIGVVKDGYITIPFDSANVDYQEYLKWVAEGNEPAPPDEPDNP
jgi:hypothetical protein